MAKIVFNDLPPFENLTEEETAEVLGAGRPFFKPTVEALEALELMAAALPHALPRPPQPVQGPPTESAQVRNLGAQQRIGVIGEVSETVQQRTVALTNALKTNNNWIIYEPRTQSPGERVSRQQITDELKMLYARGFRGLVTYSFGNGREEIPGIAKSIGFTQVIAGLWASGGAFRYEYNNLTPDRVKDVDGFCVGNETQLRRLSNEGDGGLPYLNLQSMMEQVRQLTQKPTTTADAFHIYVPGNLQYVPGMMELGDWVFPNMHPMYETGWKEAFQKPEAGVKLVTNILRDRFNPQQTGGKFVALHESWWPSAAPGQSGDYANTSSPEHQRAYFDILARATKDPRQGGVGAATDVVFVYGEAFDQPWKGGEGTNKSMGQFGGHWGLWEGINAPKAAVNNNPNFWLGERAKAPDLVAYPK